MQDFRVKRKTDAKASVFTIQLSAYSCRELNEQIVVVGLNLCLVCRAVANGSTAFVAAVNYDISALCVGERLNGAQNTAAVVGSVTGIYINVQGAKTKGAVVSRGVSEREHLLAAILADKALVVFLKSLFFHSGFPFAFLPVGFSF